MKLWNLYQTARKMHRPAWSLLGVPPSQQWTSYMVDMAVTRWGVWIESKLQEVDEQTRKPRWPPKIFFQPLPQI